MERKSGLFLSTVLIFTMLLFVGCGSAVSNFDNAYDTDETGMNNQAKDPLTESVVPKDTRFGENEPLSSDTDISADVSPTNTQTPETTDIELLIQQMTLREKIGQLFIIRPDSLNMTQSSEHSVIGVTTLTDSMIDALSDYPVGGVAMFGKNIENEEQLTDFIEALQNTSKLKLFMAIDEEGGSVARLANHSAFDLPCYESAAAVGDSGISSDALEMGETIGAYLLRYGFNMNFAPVADVNTNPDNPVIGNRAFSSDATVAAHMANAMADGLQKQNIIPVFKHFPGHGDTAEDSHSGIAINHRSQEEMVSCEWLPYQTLTMKDCVMVGHIAVPNITDTLTPATMSADVVNAVLRQQLGFDGVVITDSLAMGAITDEYSSAEAAIQAIEAGCDILLDPQNFQEAFHGLLEAVETGTIREQRIDESLYRILMLKKEYGLLD